MSTGTCDSDLDELKRLADAATPGPWKAYDACVRIADNPHTLVTAGIHCELSEAQKNAAFIAAADPLVVGSLVDRIQGLQMLMDREREYSEQLQAKVAELEELEQAARNLVKVRGRHHTEQAYQMLVAAIPNPE